MKSWIRKYKSSVIWGIVIIGAEIASICFYGELKPVIAAVGAVLLSIPIQHFWRAYTMPILEILKKPEVRLFHPGNAGIGYECNRIIVKNTGRSAAKNCKGYIVTDGGKERVCWTVEKERPTATINSNDEEGLDFCAFLKTNPNNAEIPTIIAPTEKEWELPVNCRPLDGITECKVHITAENAEPVSKSVRFNADRGEIESIT